MTIKGYEFSEEDRESMLQKKENDEDFRISLVMTIASLKKASNSEPKFISENTLNHYRLEAGRLKSRLEAAKHSKECFSLQRDVVFITRCELHPLTTFTNSPTDTCGGISANIWT